MPLSIAELDRLRLGYTHEAENLESLVACMTRDAIDVVRLCGDSGADIFMDYDDVSAATICEDQSQQNSCGGNSLTTSVEFIANKVNGEYTQLSRQCAYIWGQGNPSGDNGMSIEGGVKVARERGLPPESLWPYPNPVYYMTSPPRGVTQEQLLAAARPFIVSDSTWCDSWEKGDAHLATGQGVLYLGIPWRQSFAVGEPVIEEFSGGFRGWHAVTVLGRSRRQDSRGRRYWWLANSHGARWGRRGLAEIAPRAVEGWFRDGGRVCGLTDLKTPVVRKWDYKARPVTH